MDLKKTIALLAAEFNRLKAKYGRNKNYFFTSSMNDDMAEVQANRRRLEAARSPAERLEFINAFNSFIGHRRREFKPIAGDNFKI